MVETVITLHNLSARSGPATPPTTRAQDVLGAWYGDITIKVENPFHIELLSVQPTPKVEDNA